MSTDHALDLVERARLNSQALRQLIEAWRWQDEVRQLEPPPRPRDRTSILNRARRYLAHEPPAISGQRGHDRCFHVACILVQGFALSQDEALEAIQEWNARCQPPWSESELQHKLKDAAHQPGERGYLLHGNANPGSQPPQPQSAAVPRVPVIKAEDVASIADLVRAGSQVQWAWPGWLPTGVLTALAGEGGTGKTRFCADLLRRIRHGLPWPDGQPMTLPSDTQSLWVLADNHHDELVTLTQGFGIADCVRINAPRSDPYAGVTLQDPQDLADLDGRIQAVRPALVIIDTVGNATDLNLSRQEDAKAFYFPLQVLARRHRCVLLCLTHLNASGKFLGRRVLEKVRLALRLDQPDPGDDRRRLEVYKSNSKRPAPLGMTLGDQGNEYDHEPPQHPEGEGSQDLHPRVKEVCSWLRGRLTSGAVRVSVLRSEAETTGYSSKTLYKAKETLGVREDLIEKRKWWTLEEKEEVD